ncbi:Imm42 family immunity protein [Comamonas sp. BIGb0124]|uniref:Imm42 family immunity protein n=1 Tax=Comamonas sp. BIGb0124 TaxID=2485130 RepID=UPI000F4707F7|nr:Imm42 family immunity protein [Comamonas sp. BIGb0124]
MIIGDPFELALWIDAHQSWHSGPFVDGLFILCVDGHYLLNRKSTSIRAVTLSNEQYWWTERLDRIRALPAFDASKFTPEDLFISADYPLYEATYQFNGKRLPTQARPLDQIPSVHLTPTETLDNDWKVYLFKDDILLKDIVIYAYRDGQDIEVHRREYSYGRIGEIIEMFIDGLSAALAKPAPAQLHSPQS